MAKILQLRRGTTAQTNAFTGALSEVTVDTDKDVLVVHDGATIGGFPVAARANANGTISLIKKDGTVITTIPATGLFNNTLTSTATDQALTAAQGKVLNDKMLGVGQTYQGLTASRTVNTTYTNSTGKPILVIYQVSGANSASASAIVDGILIANVSNNAQYVTRVPMSFIVPAGSLYSVAGTTTGFEWVELR